MSFFLQNIVKLLSSQKTPSFKVLLSGVIIIACISFLLIQNNYLITSYIGDVFIPYTSIAALQQNLSLHVDFHSQFGWIYHYYYLLVAKIISFLPSIFGPSDLISLGSSLFAIAVVFVALAINQYSPSDKKIPLWILGIIIILCLSQRVVEQPRLEAITQAAAYNNNLTALFFLQLCMCYLWKDFLSLGNWPIDKKKFYVLCGLQSLFLYFFFHFKITPFAASAALTGSLLFLLPAKERITYILFISISFIIACGITAIAGYDYAGYLGDLMIAASARKKDILSLYTLLPSLGLLLLIVAEINNKPLYTTGSIFIALKSIKNSFFAMCLALASLIISLGISSIPNVYTIFIGALLIQMHVSISTNIPNGQIFYGLRVYFWWFLSLLILACFVFLNLGSSAVIYYYNKNEKAPLYRGTIGSLNFSVPAEDRENDFGLFFIKRTPETADIEKKVFKYLDKNNITFPYSMQYHLNQTEDLFSTLKRFNKKTSPNDNTFLFVGYVNFFPALLGSKIPVGSFHWLHPRITIGPDEVKSAIRKSSAQSDVAVTSFYGVFQDEDIFRNPETSEYFVGTLLKMQTFMNCQFYTYNKENRAAFKPFKKTPYNVFWAREDFIKKNNLSTIPYSDELKKEIAASCKNADYFEKTLYAPIPPEEKNK